MKLIVCLLCLAWSTLVYGGQLLHSVSGEVPRGQFTYYILMFDGPITLNLYSRSGDADLYISQHISRPTYELDSHCLQSVTCGVDTVHIPASFKRPIGIGVYGHTSHDVSSYLLEATYSDKEDFDTDLFARESTFEEIEEEVQGKEPNNQADSSTSQNSNSKARNVDVVDLGDREDDEGEVSALRSLIWPFINILLEVLVL